MKHVELRERTKQFALRIVRMFSSLPKGRVADVMGTQCLRSGTAVAANFREASRARSTAEFLATLSIVEMELDETALWIDLIVESNLLPARRMSPLQKEAEQLVKFVVTIVKNPKRRGDQQLNGH